MFAGRSSASKTHVLYTLLCCLFLIVLDIDHVTSMSLDKLVVERNEIGQDLPLSVENSESLALSAKADNSDEYVMLPGSQEEFERNTIEDNGSVGAEQDASDMLMMETNEEPAIAVVQLPVALSKEADNQILATVESLLANDNKMVKNPPIALMLADLAQQQNAAKAEKIAEVEETAAQLKQDAPQVLDSTSDVVAREQEAEVASNEEDSDSESVAEMLLEAVEGMQEALENENKINAQITAQEEEQEKEAENEILGDVIQDEIAEAAAAQSNESKEPLEEQLENQVAADVGETVLGDLEATIDDLPSVEYVDPEDGVMNAVMEVLTSDESVEDQEAAASEIDSVPEAVVESVLPGNLVSNKLFIEEPTHNAVHDGEKPQQAEKNTASSESKPMPPLNAAQSEFIEVEPEEAEALMVHEEEFDAEEAGEEPMESMTINEKEEVLKVSEENQDEAVQIAGQSQNQVHVPEKSGYVVENQVQSQEKEENLVVVENQGQVQASEENLADENQTDMDSEDEVETEVKTDNLDKAQTQDQEGIQELSEIQEEPEVLAQAQKVEEIPEPVQVQEETQAVKEKLEQAETQKETQAVDKNQKQPQDQEDVQAVEEVMASEENQAVEENQEQTQAQESLEKLEQTVAQEGNGAVEENQKESQAQEESQPQAESQKESQAQEESLDVVEKQEQSQEESQAVMEKLDQAEAQEDSHTAPESVQMQVQNPVQDQAQIQEENQVISENQEKAEVQQVKPQEQQVQEQAQTQEGNQEQALLQEVNQADVEIQSEKIENPEEENQQQELNNNEESVKKENELNINLVDLFLDEKVPEVEPQNTEKQPSENVNKQDEEKHQDQLIVQKENEETVSVMEENEEEQKLDEVPPVEQQHEEEVQVINEPTTSIEEEEEQETDETTVELDELEELEQNSVENFIEDEEKIDESSIEAQQEEAQQIIAHEEHKEDEEQNDQEKTYQETEPIIEVSHSEKQEPEKEAEPMIEKHKENQEELQDAEKENLVEQAQQEEQTMAVATNVENSAEEQPLKEEQSAPTDSIVTIPQVMKENENEPSLMDQNLEEQTIPQDVNAESQSPEEELAVNQVKEELLPFADNVQVTQDEVEAVTEKITPIDVSQDVNESEESTNAVAFNDVVPQVEAEIPVEPAQQNEAESLDLVAQNTDDKTQEVQEQEPVKIEKEVPAVSVEADKESQEIVKITEIEATPDETTVVIEEPAQTQEQSVSNIVATTQVGDVAIVDADKTQNVEEPQPLDNQNSMLTTIVQVPQLQQPQETAVQPIQADVVEEAPTKVEIAAEEQKPVAIASLSNTMTGGSLDVMDSVLNYVNASFININNNNKQKLPINNDEFNSQLRRYDGAQVWRIVVQNDRDKKLVDELHSKYDAQLWKEVKSEVDYLLKPQVLADAEKHIRRANLSRIVLIDNLQKVIEVENPPAEEIAQLQNRKGHRMTWQAYHRLEDIHGFFDYLAKTYPDICSVETIGYSIEKRALKILKISNGNAANPGIWMDGGMHAREWISPASVTFIANQIVEGWDDLPAYMRNINWYIHAVANPDGYEYTHTTDRLWRKNMRSHGRQCPGVDLNRNFGYKWGGKGTSANPCAQTYRGSKAFSEPETFYISKFISNFPRETFQAYLSFHSYGQYILYPWGYDYQQSHDRAELDLVARQAGTTITKSSGIKYTVGASATTLYPAAGGSDDWAKGIAGIKYSYTIEMGDTGRYGFVLPAGMIERNGKDGFTFVETVARAVTHQDQDIRRRALYKRVSLKSL